MDTHHEVTDASRPDEKHLHPVGSNVDVLHISHQRPYKDINFIGTYVAVGLGAFGAYGGFVMPATALLLINEDIGPSLNIYWVVLAWTLCLAVGYTLVGRLSDIFGRRWFFIVASFFAVIGCAIGGSAQTINVLIGASVFTGLGASAQISFNYTLTELVPIKDRFYVLAGIFLMAAPVSCFGPYISRLLIVHTTLGWRWTYYMNLIANGVSTLSYVIFYHPPNFDELHARRRSRWQEFMDLDFGGIFLFIAGLLLFLMGLSWGGSLYPWKSAHVIATLVIGFVVCVIFVLYECYMPLKRPLIPMHLFANPDYCVLTTVSAVGGILYYSLNVIYPTMVATLFTTDVVKQGLLSVAIGGGVGLGQFGASCVANVGGNIRWKIFGTVAACTAFSAGLAGAKTQETASALAVLCSVCIGALESFAGVAVTIVITDQTEIGAAAGAYGSIRSIAGVLGTAIFSTILNNKVRENTANHVVPALIKAGLPVASVETLLTALSSGNEAAVAKVPGITTKIVGVAVTAIQGAYSNAFSIVFLVTIAFGGISTIAAFFTPAIEDRYTDEVMRQLHPTGGKRNAPDGTLEKVAEMEHREEV